MMRQKINPRKRIAEKYGPAKTGQLRDSGTGTSWPAVVIRFCTTAKLA